ncbi:TPA: hypothetical protein IQC28_002781 [Listeria monocytogenes]|nr:hypothetical protein [Listeria monocytogenes]EHC5259599.1 hypothetical protein [Listeria monocytogenes serotype 1/2a]EDP7792442.1 hypothetical protein [Listeria monocytogenes]MPC04471.1 hypothetical protein [Listeria monocytogenes]HAA6494390.1 hypothetical protein [Listeria monocytogenes]
MNHWKKWLSIFFLACILWGSSITFVQAEETINDKPVSSDPVTLYNEYENFSFPLMTKDTGSLNPVTQASASMAIAAKNGTWEATKFVGLLNAKATGFLFDFDAMKPIRQPILDITNEMANSLLGVATTLGVMALAVIMIIKFAMEQNFKQVMLVFFMAVLVVASIVTMGNPDRSKAIMNVATDLDTAVAGAFMSNSSALEDGKESSYTSPGVKVASNIFKANVFIPYLINNYGTSDINTINKKKIEYNKKEYSRLSLLMNNGDSEKLGDDFVSDVAKIEADTLNNKNVAWKKSMSTAIINIFFLLLNIIQFIIYFALFLLKSMLGFLLLFMFPLSILILLFSMFSSQLNPFKNIGKGYITVMLFKGAVSFLAVFYTSYMMIAYRTSDEYNNVFIKIIVILLYVVLPMILYIWRTFLLTLIIGLVTGQNAAPHRLVEQLRHPLRSSADARQERKERARERKNEEKKKDGKEKGKSGKTSLSDVIKVPQNIARQANKARKGLQKKINDQKEAQLESEQRITASEARKGQKQAEDRRDKDYGRLFKHVPVGEGKNGELSDSQRRILAKREGIQQKHEELRKQKEREEQQNRMAENTKQHKVATASNLSQRRQNNQETSAGRTGQEVKKNPPLKKGNVQPLKTNGNAATNPTPKIRKPQPGSAVTTSRQPKTVPNTNVGNTANAPRSNTSTPRNNVARTTTRKPAANPMKGSNRQPLQQNRKPAVPVKPQKVVRQRPVTGATKRAVSPRQMNRRK